MIVPGNSVSIAINFEVYKAFTISSSSCSKLLFQTSLMMFPFDSYFNKIFSGDTGLVEVIDL